MIVLILSILLSAFPAYGMVATPYYSYGPTSNITDENLNGNFNRLINILNDLDNDNAATDRGYRFIEVVGALPVAGNQGRVVFVTSNNTLYFDNGSQFVQAATMTGTPVQGDILYHDGTTFVLLNKNTTSTRYLSNTGTGSNPAWAQINIVNGLTIASQAQGDIIYADAATSFARLAAGTSGRFLKTQGSGANPTWSNLPMATQDAITCFSNQVTTANTFQNLDLDGACTGTTLPSDRVSMAILAITADGAINTEFRTEGASTDRGSGWSTTAANEDGMVVVFTDANGTIEIKGSNNTVTITIYLMGYISVY